MNTAQAVDYVARYTLESPEQPVMKYTELNVTELEGMPAFDTESVHASVVAAHAQTRAWVRSILDGSSPHWLTLYGVPGCGKTMLAKLARHTLKEKGETVQLWNWPKVITKCLNGEWDILDHLIKLPILILDDVGAEYTGSQKSSSLNSAHLYEIAESRLGKWTLITSNLNIPTMANVIGPRFVSRLFRNDGVICDLMQATDYSYAQWAKRNNFKTH